ncbi:MAG: SPOR domain-containing protein [Candidatus Zixiibacteriota bacterium]
MATGCGGLRPPDVVETKPAPVTKVPPGFDPLGLPQDTVNIPAQLASQAEKQSPQAPGVQTAPGDTATHQVYRVQLLTFEAYGEGRHGLQVAEEIFDQPVLLDYDVPYFKLRVGEFRTRAEAEAYVQKARSVGYPNAIVVTANVGVQQALPMYEAPRVPKSTDSLSRDISPKKAG